MREKEQGFTLMETLVAMMVLGISLVMVLQLFSGGLRSEKRAADTTRALMHAQAVMDRFLLAPDYTTAETEGVFDDGYAWTLTYEAYEPEMQDDAGGLSVVTYPVDLIWVAVSVRWAAGAREKTLALSTLKLVDKLTDDSTAGTGNAS